MTKRQLIDHITTINVSARPSFLAAFGEDDLQAYLEHLNMLQQPRLSGDPGRFEKHFTPEPRPQFIYDAPRDANQTQATDTDDDPGSDEQPEDPTPTTGLLEPVDGPVASYQPQQAEAKVEEVDEDTDSPQDRPLTPVMAGAAEADTSPAAADDENETWLF